MSCSKKSRSGTSHHRSRQKKPTTKGKEGNMDVTIPVIETEASKQGQQLHKQLEALHQNLRTVRHAVNNNVAVIMAMAELSQRNPAQCQKLCQLCLDKAPQIAAAIAGFSEL